MGRDIEQELKEILVEDLFVEGPPAEIDEDAGLQSTYGIDSIGFTELKVNCEERFDIRIPSEAFTPEYFATLADLAGLVRDLREGKTVVSSAETTGN